MHHLKDGLVSFNFYDGFRIRRFSTTIFETDELNEYSKFDMVIWLNNKSNEYFLLSEIDFKQLNFLIIYFDFLF